jgi:hypothetical protein
MGHDEPYLSPMTDLLDGITYQTRSLLAVVDSDMFKRKKLAEAKLLASYGMPFAYDSKNRSWNNVVPLNPAPGGSGSGKNPSAKSQTPSSATGISKISLSLFSWSATLGAQRLTVRSKSGRITTSA